MNAATGAPLEGEEHLAQSIGDILATPIGSRVMRRDYGSLLFELIDGPFNLAHQVKLFAAIAVALFRWEPRIRLTRVAIAPGEQLGQVSIGIEAERVDRPGPNNLVRLTLPLRLPAAFAPAAALA